MIILILKVHVHHYQCIALIKGRHDKIGTCDNVPEVA